MRNVVVAAALIGCGDGSNVASTIDAPADSPTDSIADAEPPDAQQTCFGAGLAGMKCFGPESPLVIENVVALDTSDDPRCHPSVTDACFLVGSSIELRGRLEAFGNRPLVLWSATTIAITGELDVSSEADGRIKRGPAANLPGCTASPGSEVMGITKQVGGGGSGGAFGSAGGGGGTGFFERAQEIVSASGGASAAPISLGLRGGCDGGIGGFALTAGAGGGAVYLLAPEMITVSGLIDASGGGGTGGVFEDDVRGGGSGGGSGGLIGLETHTYVLTEGARLVALGGGGGAGTSEVFSGNRGRDPGVDPVNAGAGGISGSSNTGGTGSAIGGGDGAAGGNTSNTFEGGGGGGGGGGAGFIVRRFTDGLETGVVVVAPPFSL